MPRSRLTRSLASPSLRSDPLVHDLPGAWHLSVVDIESTLRHVCKKVLTDRSVGKERLKRRAEALKVVGDAFLAAECEEGKGEGGKKKSLREHLQAFIAPMTGGAATTDDAEWAAAFAAADAADAEAAKSAEAAESDSDEGVAVFTREELNAMPVKRLRALMTERGLDASGCIEKADFVAALAPA